MLKSEINMRINQDFLYFTTSINDGINDCNDYIKDGVYFFNNAASPSNLPSEKLTAAGYLIVSARTSNDILQMWVEYNAQGRIYHRQKQAGSWKPWIQITGEKSYMCINLTTNTDVTTGTAWSTQKIPFNHIYTTKGDAFTFTNNGIKVNRTCYVRLHGKVMLQHASDRYGMAYLMADNRSITAGYDSRLGGYQNITLASIPILLEKDTVLTLNIGSAADNTTTGIGGTIYTHLTVEEI